MKLGIVGLPNVGKSTLFNAITNAGAQSANYPFCTIEPNVGVVAVPDSRLDKLAEMYDPEKYTPASIEFVDITSIFINKFLHISNSHKPSSDSISQGFKVLTIYDSIFSFKTIQPIIQFVRNWFVNSLLETTGTFQ